ncbi:hypothetical protein [Streptomyces sp. NRRL S-15]|uniref:hypothetical protein n=1 Tax=Streptomyces sp. NRRL S-15 TaxID=1463886 RepID=UPI0004CC413E|nr:hypothetical protein [Streptomyces sp. NRRL S-15]
MSNQYPPQQPYGQPHQPYTGAPGYPPPPPKKKMSGGAIVAIVLGSVFGGIFILLLIIGLAVGDDTSPSDDKASVLEVTASPSESAAEKAAKPAEKTSEKPKPAEPKKAAEYPSGDYVVGEDIPAGTYTSTGAEKGIFELCTITTEPADDTTMPKIKTANADERVIVTLAKDDGVVSISGCEPLKPRK